MKIWRRAPTETVLKKVVTRRQVIVPKSGTVCGAKWSARAPCWKATVSKSGNWMKRWRKRKNELRKNERSSFLSHVYLEIFVYQFQFQYSFLQCCILLDGWCEEASEASFWATFTEHWCERSEHKSRVCVFQQATSFIVRFEWGDCKFNFNFSSISTQSCLKRCEGGPKGRPSEAYLIFFFAS